MTTESTATPAQQIAAGYAVEGQALELGTVVVDGAVDPTAQVRIPLATVNRHGLVAGATGTGKTKSLQVIAEQLSAAGVPVMMADVKGDLSGLSRPGEANDKTTQRAKDTGDDWTPTAFPVEFLSLGTSRDRCAGARHHLQLRAHPAVKGAGAQRHSGVHPRPDLPLGRPEGPVAAGPQGSAGGDPVPHQRRGQARAEGSRRGVADDRGRDPARAGQPRGRGRRHLLRRARTGAQGSAARSTRRAAASSACSSWATRPPGR